MLVVMMLMLPCFLVQPTFFNNIEHRHKLQGTAMLVFQPAEEGGAGAKKIVDAGVLENVGAIFGLHASTEYTIGLVSSGAGPVLAGAGSFEAVISGKGGHAAMPQHTIDPILAASKVVTVATFQGRGAFNVIPDSVTIGGTFRAFSKESFIQLKQRIEEVITRQASVHRCNATVIFSSDGEKHFYPVTINDKHLHENFQNVAEQMLGTKSIKEMKPEMGAEDFSFYQEVIPGNVFYVGMADDKRGPFADEHSPFFRVNEDVLLYGAALHASLAARYPLEHQPEPPSSKGTSHDEL